ncbi:MAG: Ig-like domain-containing protein [Defluviitaleaceae bacterium]|nr:Ig-like domain-containing protein [Defluviitaleaceae bacterium]
MLSKFSNLSKSDKKLIFTVAGIALVLLIAVACIAMLTNMPEKNDGLAENTENTENRETTQPYPPQNEALPPSVAPSALGSISILPLSQNEFGVTVDSDFLITSETNALDTEHLISYLSSRNGEQFTITEREREADENAEFILQFDNELEPNKIVSLVYQPPYHAPTSHAFQTADLFRIITTSPASNTHNVPLDGSIQVTFNRELGGLTAFNDALVFDPPLDGRVLQLEDSFTYVFAPTALASNTTYRVTVKQGLVSVLGEAIDEDYTFSFSTRWGNTDMPPFSVLGDVYENFLPWDEVFIELEFPRDFTARSFTVELSKLDDYGSYINFDGTGETPIDSYELEVVEFGSQYDASYYLFLETTLPVGYYVARIRAEDIDTTAHKFIQVSPLSVYSLVLNDEAIFWVNDAETGEPAQGAKIAVDGYEIITDSDGIARTTTTTVSRQTQIVVDYAPHLPFVYTTPTYDSYTLIPSDRFLSYMYTDRPRYRPDDTIDVFGVIMPRYGHSHSSEDVFTLKIGDMLEMPISLDSHSSFAVRVPVTNMLGNATIEIQVNGERLMSSWVYFIDYTNLEFILSEKLDKLVYEPDEIAQVEITVTNFAEQPIADVELVRRWADELSPYTRMSTGADGIARGELQIITRGTTWQPYWDNAWYAVQGDAQGSQGISLNYITVPRDIMLEHEWNGDTLLVSTNEILAEKIAEHYKNERIWTPIANNVFRGEPVDVDFEIIVTRHVTTRTERSRYYDRINRREAVTYDYSHTRDENYMRINGRTVNGKAEITSLPSSQEEPLISYSFEIRCKDTRGREIVVWPWRPWWYDIPLEESNLRNFIFVPEKRSLCVNETTAISLREFSGWRLREDTTEPTQGRLLLMTTRDKILSANVSSPQGAEVTFTQEGD